MVEKVLLFCKGQQKENVGQKVPRISRFVFRTKKKSFSSSQRYKSLNPYNTSDDEVSMLPSHVHLYALPPFPSRRRFCLIRILCHGVLLEDGVVATASLRTTGGLMSVFLCPLFLVPSNDNVNVLLAEVPLRTLTFYPPAAEVRTS